MAKQLAFIGAPSSAAGHWPGMEKAPAFLRRAELPQRLRMNGATVADYGDLPMIRWKADLISPRAQNLDLVVDYLNGLAERVDSALAAGQWPIIVGGECTVTVGAVAGFLRHNTNVGLLYLDGHIDLNTPASSSSGILDSMGVAHMLGLEGTSERLSHLGPRFPMLAPERIVYFGHNQRKMNEVEIESLKQYGMVSYPVATIDGTIYGLALEALARMEERAELFLLHFDVDVIRFKDFPIANVPIHNEGLSFDQAIEAVAAFVGSPKCAGLVITEINPDHATESLGDRFAASIARAVVPDSASAGRTKAGARASVSKP